MGFAQYAEFRHAAADRVRDAQTSMLGVMLTRSFSTLPGAPTVGVRFSWTQEDNQRLRSDLDRQVPLLRIFGAVTPMPSLRISAGLTVYQQLFGNVDIGFGTERRDSAIAGDLVANYALDERWSLRGDAGWSRNRSNQDLYDSSRKAVSLKVRYQY